MNTGIYKITNTVNGKRYIGSAVSFNDRWQNHKRGLRNGNHRSSRLQNAWKKYGEAAFVFEKVLVCSRENLLMYEQRCFDEWSPEYNICKIAGSLLGTKRTPAERAKISAALRGGKRPPLSDERKAKMSAAMRGRPQRPEVVSARAAAQMGRTHTAASKVKMSAAQRGRKGAPLSDEHKASISAAWLGRRRSLETRAKMSAAKLGTKHSPEHIARRSAALRAYHVRRRALKNTECADGR